MKAPDPALAMWWTAATALGHVLIATVYWLVNAFGSSRYEFRPVPLLISRIIGLTGVGIAQGLVLRRYVRRFQWGKWALYTVFGYILSFALTIF